MSDGKDARGEKNSVWHDMLGNRQYSTGAVKKKQSNHTNITELQKKKNSTVQRTKKRKEDDKKKGVGNQQQQALHCKNGL